MKRILLFVATNVAVLAVISIVFRVFGLESIVSETGGLNLTSLLIFSAVIGFAGSFISLAISKKVALWTTGAKVISQPSNSTESWLLATVQNQAGRAGIGMPDVAIYDAPEVNAFATGMSRNKALVAVSTGLLRNMSQAEAEAVLAHEVSHVANGDMVTMTLLQGVLNTFVIFLSRVVGFFVDRVVFRNEHGAGIGFFLTSLVAQIIFGILATIIVHWFSRRREFRADAGGAELAGREKMVAALEKLRATYEPSELPKQLSAFGIAGLGAQGLKKLFMTHPPLEERINALKARGY
ncbi:protease HtpX [Lentisalinibacter sediminis]|uniref:protease HtpX n=1 Tax=Lentisalinibacter sediminis TaxID=2992237 RepID=UPI0038635DEF